MPKNDVTKSPKAPVVLGGAQALQVKLIGEIEEANTQTGATLTDYGKRCIINAIGGLVQVCKNQEIDMTSLDPTLLRLQLANVGYLELNYSAGEVYFDFRKSTVWSKEPDPKTGKHVATEMYQVTIKPQGIGNEQLTRKYGVGLKPQTGLRNPWIVREGDEFEYPQFDGVKVTPPKWRIKNPDGKVMLVVYCAEKSSGEIEYLMATRESVKANIIAQIRQNMLYDSSFKKKTKEGKDYIDKGAREEFYQELNKFAESHTLDELLAEPKYAECVNPTYTSGGSKEQMILRKMKNNALKNYPKDYGQAYVFDAVRDMYEDRDDSLDEPPMIVNRATVIDQVNDDIEEDPPVENAPKDFEVNDEGEVIENTQKVEEEETTEESATEGDTEAEEEEDYGF